MTAATPTRRPADYRDVRASTLALALGAFLFVLPIPGTFTTGALVLVAALFARWRGW